MIMLQAIETKYLGPTNHKGSRVKAKCNAATITVSWDHSLNQQDNHLAAAKALQAKMNWDKHNDLIGGGTDKGYVFVQIEKDQD